MASKPLTLFIPLPGLHSPLASTTIGTMRVFQVDLVTWHLLESFDFTDDLVGDVLRRPPHFCVLETHVDRDKRAFHRATRLVHSLRLLKTGEIYDPADFIIYEAAPGGIIRQYTGRFGRKVYDLDGTFVLAPGEDVLATRLLALLEALDTAHDQRRLQLAEKLFQQSYEPSFADPRESILVLVGCIEALGGNEVLLRKIDWPDASIPTMLSKFRHLRNTVCHGGTEFAVDAKETLQALARFLLRAALAEHCKSAPVRRIGGPSFLRSLVDRHYDLASDWYTP